MRWQYAPYSYLLFLGAAMVAAIAFYAWRRGVPGAKLLALFMAAVSIWGAAYAFELAATSLPAKTLWAKVEYLGIVAVPPAYLAFALRYTGAERWLTRRTFALLTVPPLVTLTLVFTNEAHELLWRRVGLDASGPFPALEIEHGAWFWVHWAYSSALMALGTFLLISALPSSLRLYRRQSWALLFAVVVPWVGNVVYVLGLGPVTNLDPTPFAFLLSAIAIALGIFRFRFLDIVPVARDAVVEGLRDGVVALDLQGRVVDLNPSAQNILGFSAALAVGRSVEEVASGLFSLPEDYHRTDGRALGEVAIGDGSARRYYDLSLSTLERRRKRHTGYLLVLRDITQRKRTEEKVRQLNEKLEKRVAQRTGQLEAAMDELRGSEERFRSLVQNASDIVAILEADGTIRYESPAVERVLGYRPEEMVGTNVFGYVHPEDVEQIKERITKARNHKGVGPPAEFRFRRSDGTWCYLEAIGNNLIGNPSVGGIVVNCRDITERKALEEQLKHQALHDPLTKLPNRVFFLEKLKEALAHLQRGGGRIAILFLDLDNFKVVNDSLGHEAGDRLLVAMGERLQKLLRPTDMAARLGGDEFIVLLESVTERDVAQVAERILNELGQPFNVGSKQVTSSASIGIVLSDRAQDQPGDLLRKADLAMYRAKESGKTRYMYFDPSLNSRIQERLRLENDLRRAIEREEIFLHYQPNIRLETGEIVGFEALARWEHPERGLVYPSEFIPIAEETGSIVRLGRWVLAEACRQAGELQERFPKDLVVSVNLSARQLRHPTLVEEVAEVLRRTGLEPGTLILELTESIAMENAGAAIATLEELKSLGVGLAIDDFGKGYSSLSYLKHLPVDTLKIDRSIVSGLERDSGDRAIVSATITLAHALGLRVVAEGVQNADQAAELRSLGCDVGQGYYWWKALPAEDLATLLASELDVPRSG